MPWSETTPMSERMRFIWQLESCEFTMTELCEAFGIARKTGYKWAQRYAEEGWEGLKDRSRAPTQCPHRTEKRCEDQLVAWRRKHPSWGARKLLSRLERRYPDWSWPAPSTAGAILKLHGLVRSRPRRRSKPSSSKPEVVARRPNDLWSADFKGHFRTGDRRVCHPLTIADRVSRYLLECRARDSTSHDQARPIFEAAFREHGLPRAMLCDTGPPFGSGRAPRHLSRLAVWWIRLGIEPLYIEPGHPEQNGAHERMHRTLKAETARPPHRSFAAQQAAFHRFRREYNHERPHEALDFQMPAELYRPSSRPFPRRLPAVEYPGHFEVRNVHSKGEIKWQGQRRFISEVLQGERVGLEEIDDGRWSVYFCSRLLGRYDERNERLELL